MIASAIQLSNSVKKLPLSSVALVLVVAENTSPLIKSRRRGRVRTYFCIKRNIFLSVAYISPFHNIGGELCIYKRK